ncbi:MAG: hypothetical protein PHU88_03595 [candidate division Zixibacteria bacterium]|nr:hypothetical protein [candidate division Zixibacteria bacterium]MDD5427334.1 hypothetical protein [candidate division Zixibacteria bacterium]
MSYFPIMKRYMQRLSSGWVGIALMAVLLVNCSDDESSPTGLSATCDQTAVVVARKIAEQGAGQEKVNLCYVEGLVTGSPLPSLQYFQVKLGCDSAMFSDYEYIRRGLGTIAFDIGNYVISSFFDSVNVLIKTSSGVLQGSMIVPDSLDSMIVSITENGVPISVSWYGSDADFFRVTWLYTTASDMIFFDTFVVGTTMSFPEPVHSYESTVYLTVHPVNGPYPLSDEAVGNMSGTGTGYLFYVREDFVPSDFKITIGDGFLPSSDRSVSESIKFIKSIASRLKIMEKKD